MFEMTLSLRMRPLCSRQGSLVPANPLSMGTGFLYQLHQHR